VVVGIALTLGGAGVPTVPVAARAPTARSVRTRAAIYDRDVVLGRFRVAIGGGGLGQKLREGDRVTPVGHYHVVRRGPERWQSRWLDFLLLDYPNDRDKERFRALKAVGKIPVWAAIGSAIGIHGGMRASWVGEDRIFDWTYGCVGMLDDDLEQVAAWVPDGTPVDIED
jgi:murein L,D-transpeptidase YafK